MSTQNLTATKCGKAAAGGCCSRRPYRKWELDQKDVPDADQAAPVRVAFGRVRTAGVWMTPLFNIQATQVVTEYEVSKK